MQSGKKTSFPGYPSATQIESLIRQAYKSGSRIRSQGDRVLVGGSAGGFNIRMWVNNATKKIETAYIS